MEIAVSVLIISFLVGSDAEATVVQAKAVRAMKAVNALSHSQSLQCPHDNVVDHVNCKKVEGLKIQYNEAIDKKNNEQRRKIENQILSIYPSCLDERFSKCYPDLHSQIALKDLNAIFNALKSDKRFRYPNGGMGMCHYRAENLSFYLAEAGFKTKTIRIDHSPTLIAMDRNGEGMFNGNYDDYKGSHTLVQIDVEVNGKVVPYLLDPQYMQEALPRDEYFIRTTGQICKKQESERSDFIDLTLCYFHEEKQNKSAEDLFTLFMIANRAEDIPYLQCGWASGQKTESVNVGSDVPSVKKADKKISCTNGDTPSAFLNMDVSSDTYKKLIINAYETYQSTLKKELKLAEDQLKMQTVIVTGNAAFDEESRQGRLDWEKHKRRVKYSIQKTDQMLKRVKANLGGLP